MIASLAMLLLFADPPAKAAPDVGGLWMGRLNVGIFQSLRLVVEIKKTPKGWSATVDSLDQGAYGMPVDKVEFDGETLRFEMKALHATYEGKRKPNGVFEGTWNQAGKLALSLAKIDKRPDMRRPQDPVKPYPYAEEQVGYENPNASGVKFAGTLTIPKGAGPHPAVLMITGSGAQNRDEEILNHRPFHVIADYLTRRGVAVLRVDDRGVGGSTGATPKDTSADFAGDVLAGVQYLKTRKDVDPKRIGLVGHSEGGMIAPMVAVNAPDDVAFLVLLAGTGIPGEQILYLQAEKIIVASGGTKETAAANRRTQEAMFEIVRREADPKKAAVELRAALARTSKDLPEALRKAAGGEAAINAQVTMVNSAWMRYFLTYDPKPTLAKVRCPVLAMNGERDLQVPPKENIEAIKAAMAGNNDRLTAVVLPKLNHLFQTCSTGSVVEYGTIGETFSPVALKTMGDWIVKTVGLPSEAK